MLLVAQLLKQDQAVRGAAPPYLPAPPLLERPFEQLMARVFEVRQ